MQEGMMGNVHLTSCVCLAAHQCCKKRSRQRAVFNAMEASELPACSLRNPSLIDGMKPVHINATTPDNFDTCYQKQVSIVCVTAAFARMYLVAPMHPL